MLRRKNKRNFKWLTATKKIRYQLSVARMPNIPADRRAWSIFHQ